MTMDTLKADSISLEELHSFMENASAKIEPDIVYTIDYFDPTFGVLNNKEKPSILEFFIATLQELLNYLKPRENVLSKMKYTAFLLNLATRGVEFDLLYEIFHQIEKEIRLNDIQWSERKVRILFENQIVEKLIVKEDELKIPESDVYESKVDMEIESSNIGEIKKENKQRKTSKKKNCKIDKLTKSKGAKEQLISEEESRKSLNLTESLEDDIANKIEEDDNFDEGEIDKEDKQKYPHKCLQCNFRAKYQLTLDKHAFKEHKATRLCTQCGYLSSTFQEFKDHDKTHTLTCEICNIKILGSRSFRSHMSTKHENSEDAKVPCDICGALLQVASLKVHIAMLHGNKTHKCDLCDFTASGKYYVTRHRKLHFLKPSKCPVCGRMVKNLDKHFRLNCNKKDKERFTCNLCEKTFSLKQSLDRHIKHIHQKVTGVHCNMCDFQTTDSYHLRVHVSMKHTKENILKTCQYCEKKTSNLDHHIKIYHYEELLKNNSIVQQSS